MPFCITISSQNNGFLTISEMSPAQIHDSLREMLRSPGHGRDAMSGVSYPPRHLVLDVLTWIYFEGIVEEFQ
jgi:hypothetical protein